MKDISFGSMIRSLRKQNNLTQAALASRLGITDKAVSKWERDISYPDIFLFPRLADELGVSVEDLLTHCTGHISQPRLLQIFRMSHDIRSPLNIILGYARLAEEYCDDRDRLLRYLENIRVSAEYLQEVFDSLMEVAHPGRVSSEPDYLYYKTAVSSEPEFLSCKTAVSPERESEKEARAELEENSEEKSEVCLKAEGDPNVLYKNYDFTGKRVLVAEDMALNREIVFELLKKTGIDTEFAEDGTTCLEKIRQADQDYYDLILMDIMMPGMDGIEATRAIRLLPDEKKASIPIVAMTANVYEEDKKKAFEAGMNGFTEKPIRLTELLEVMKRNMFPSR